jgi:hypothetical protein
MRCGAQEFAALLRLSSNAQQRCCEAGRALPPALCDMDSGAGFAAEDNGFWVARAAALERPGAGTSGLEECMGEAQAEEGSCCEAAPQGLEAAVLTILREIGEDPQREVRLKRQPFPVFRSCQSYCWDDWKWCSAPHQALQGLLLREQAACEGSFRCILMDCSSPRSPSDAWCCSGASRLVW